MAHPPFLHPSGLSSPSVPSVPSGSLFHAEASPGESDAENPAGHGGNVWAAARRVGAASGDILDLSTNTFVRMADATSTIVRAALAEHGKGEDFLHYPDPDSWRLRQALALAESVEPACLLPGAGASELIWAALTALRPQRALFIGPLFSQYARACDALGIPREAATPPESGRGSSFESADGQNGVDGSFVGGFAPDAALLERIAKSRHEGVDLIVACSPNNPGCAVLTDPRPLLDAVGNRTLLLDASYKDFLDDPARKLHSLAALSPFASGRVILLGSLTKFYCCPGIRLGWLASDPDFVARAASCRPAWTLPALAENVGLSLLAHTADYRAALPALHRDVARLTATLSASGLFRLVLPGVSFAIAALRDPALTVSLQEYLLARHRILIRVCDNIPGMPPGFVRLQARPDTERIEEGLAGFGGLRPPIPPGRGVTPLHPHHCRCLSKNGGTGRMKSISK